VPRCNDGMNASYIPSLILGIQTIATYIARRQMRWLGHVWRMSVAWLPKELLAAWVPQKRLVGRPELTLRAGATSSGSDSRSSNNCSSSCNATESSRHRATRGRLLCTSMGSSNIKSSRGSSSDSGSSTTLPAQEAEANSTRQHAVQLQDKAQR
jgi:hypothetical protein